MRDIPEELRKRWAARDQGIAVAEIQTISLTEYDPSPPELDSLDDFEDTHPAEPFLEMPTAESDVSSPSINRIKMHGIQTVVPKTISVADYVHSAFSETRDHQHGARSSNGSKGILPSPFFPDVSNRGVHPHSSGTLRQSKSDY